MPLARRTRRGASRWSAHGREVSKSLKDQACGLIGAFLCTEPTAERAHRYAESLGRLLPRQTVDENGRDCDVSRGLRIRPSAHVPFPARRSAVRGSAGGTLRSASTHVQRARRGIGPRRQVHRRRRRRGDQIPDQRL